MGIGPGVAGTKASQRTTGFEVRIHLKDGVVERVGSTRYQEPEKREN